MRKYNKSEYLKYVKELEKDGFKDCAISFKDWKEVQPIADKASGITNKIIKSHTRKKRGGYYEYSRTNKGHK